MIQASERDRVAGVRRCIPNPDKCTTAMAGASTPEQGPACRSEPPTDRAAILRVPLTSGASCAGCSASLASAFAGFAAEKPSLKGLPAPWCDILPWKSFEAHLTSLSCESKDETYHVSSNISCKDLKAEEEGWASESINSSCLPVAWRISAQSPQRRCQQHPSCRI